MHKIAREHRRDHRAAKPGNQRRHHEEHEEHEGGTRCHPIAVNRPFWRRLAGKGETMKLEIWNHELTDFTDFRSVTRRFPSMNNEDEAYFQSLVAARAHLPIPGQADFCGSPSGDAG